MAKLLTFKCNYSRFEQENLIDVTGACNKSYNKYKRPEQRILKHLHATISHKDHYRYLVFGIHQNVIIKYKLSQKVLVYAHTMRTYCINEPAKRICMPV